MVRKISKKVGVHKKRRRYRRRELKDVRRLERLQANLLEFQEVSRTSMSTINDMRQLLNDGEAMTFVRMFKALPVSDQKLVAQVTWKLYQKRKLH